VSANTPSVASMTRLPHDAYLDHLRTESHRFREVLTDCDPRARVPSCPDWSAWDLAYHLAEVQWFWGGVVMDRPKSPGDQPDLPRGDTFEDTLDTFDDVSQRLVDALAKADPADPAWTWSVEQTVGFIFRRQAHEALIHRLDAELVAGRVTPLDATLAADGVDETLDVMFGGCPPWGEFSGLPHHVRVDMADTDDRVWVQIGRFSGTDPDGVHHEEDDIHVVGDPDVEPDAVVSGPAGALDAWLWRRGDDSQVHVTGDKAVYDHFRLAVNHPIN